MFTEDVIRRPPIVAVAGDRAYSPLLNGRRNRWVQATITATVNITTLGTAVLNQGSALALFDEMGIDMNGIDIGNGDPRLWGYYAEAMRPSASSVQRLTSFAVGTYVTREQVRIGFENPYAVEPRETQFIERDPSAPLRMFFKLAATASQFGRLVAGGAGTVTINTFFVEQCHDPGENHLPVFQPQWSPFAQIIPGAANGIEIPIPLSQLDYLRGITILQDAGGVAVNDIVLNIGLRTDDDWIIGPEMPTMNDMAIGQEYDFGGSNYGTYSSRFLHINFQKYGRLAKILQGNQGKNLRLVVDCQASATAGTMQIKGLLHKLVRDPFVGTNGRTTVDLFNPLPW